MIFPGLDCSFGGVAAMAVWWNSLETDLILGESEFEFFGTFVVQDVELGGISVGLETGV